MKGKISFFLILIYLLVIAASGYSFLTSVPKAEVSASLEPGEVKPGDQVKIYVTYTFPPNTHQVLQKEYFTFSLVTPGDFSLGEIQYPEGLEKDGETLYYDTATLSGQVRIPPREKPGEKTLIVKASYQLCDEAGLCFLPQEEEINLSLQLLEGKKQNLLILLVFAFLGGIILNIMPCVLPVLSIRAFSLVKGNLNNRKDLLLSSLSYALGILVSLLILGIIVILIKLSGQMIGWGFQFQEKGFVLFLFTLLVLFALSLFDLFIIQGITLKSSGKDQGEERGIKRYLGSFASGAFVVLLATPCTAPLLGTALGFAFASPPGTILLIFLSLGLGLAFPFLLLGLWPGAVKILPKPGNWMKIFKTVLGFLLLAMAAEMLDILVRQMGTEVLISLLLYGLGLALAAWIYGLFSTPERTKRTRILALILLLLAVIGGFVLVLRGTEVKKGSQVLDSSGTEVKYGWQKFSPEAVAKAREEEKSVFIIFSAAWCLTCRTNEITVLSTQEILKAFRDKGVAVFYGDFTSPDPVISQWIRDYGRAGVPVYAYYSPGSENARILPEILTKGIVLSALQND